MEVKKVKMVVQRAKEEMPVFFAGKQTSLMSNASAKSGSNPYT